MNWMGLISEVLKAIVWPAVVCFIGYRYKDIVANILGGLKSAKYGEAEVIFSQKRLSEEAEVVEHNNLFVPADVTGLRPDMEEKLRVQLRGSDESKIDILVKNLAQEQINRFMDRCYSYIYGSQIKMLDYLQRQEGGAAPANRIAIFYEEAKAQFPAWYENYLFSQYISFMVYSRLIIQDGNGWKITQEGRGFLAYLIANNYNLAKAG
ncbi:hypothetical protein [Chromobacterium subtsugae]|uniref:hypothetical protein n=1 Tax=Chromobacterium subtsugae TaxID=251747 RepID=UPI00128D1B28|nr:hypothetical protein [Chromobacterium subtsugae]